MYNDVKTFIEACDQERNTENSILYHNLIKEEYQEYLDSIDSVDELDACMDMIWVILGYCYMQGYDVDGAWKEVARSNLAKIDPDTGKVIKNEHGKVMKPDGWTPPVLEPYIK
jgi:predicted HAD superfamily Cof-like phosphohydrolase